MLGYCLPSTASNTDIHRLVVLGDDETLIEAENLDELSKTLFIKWCTVYEQRIIFLVIFFQWLAQPMPTCSLTAQGLSSSAASPRRPPATLKWTFPTALATSPPLTLASSSRSDCGQSGRVWTTLTETAPTCSTRTDLLAAADSKRKGKIKNQITIN